VTFHHLFNSIDIAVENDPSIAADKWFETLAISFLQITAIVNGVIVITVTISQMENLTLSEALS